MSNRYPRFRHAAPSRAVAAEADEQEASASSAAGGAPPVSANLEPSAVLDLQRTAGNYAVQRRVSHATAPASSEKFSMRGEGAFVATIKRPDSDAEPGNELTDAIDPQSVGDALASASPAAADAAEGETVTLPDIVVPDSLEVAESDAVGGTLTYAGSINQSGSVSPFGATSWASLNLTGITVTSGAGTFTVRATLQNPITFNVNAGGRTNVASDSDPALTATNYTTASSDLTPDTGDLNGRPPRTQFWAEDLTIRHERFHANERFGFAQSGLAASQAWLGTQTAGSVADVQALLNQVPPRVIAASQAAMPYPAKEERAYGDGASLYKSRADAIKTKGAAGAYP